MMRTRWAVVLPILAGVCATGLLATLPAQAAGTASFRMSSIPKTVLMNAHTGQVLSIVADATTTVQPDITWQPICDSGNLCYFTNVIPYADEGFYGSAGTYTGSWPYRAGFSTGNY